MKIGVCFQQRSVTGSKALKEDHRRETANSFAILRPAIHLRYPRISWRGSVSVLLMRDLADTLEMGLGGSLVVMIAASRL